MGCIIIGMYHVLLKGEESSPTVSILGHERDGEIYGVQDEVADICDAERHDNFNGSYSCRPRHDACRPPFCAHQVIVLQVVSCKPARLLASE